jgi:hypothetical protein
VPHAKLDTLLKQVRQNALPVLQVDMVLMQNV